MRPRGLIRPASSKEAGINFRHYAASSGRVKVTGKNLGRLADVPERAICLSLDNAPARELGQRKSGEFPGLREFRSASKTSGNIARLRHLDAASSEEGRSGRL